MELDEEKSQDVDFLGNFNLDKIIPNENASGEIMDYRNYLRKAASS